MDLLFYCSTFCRSVCCCFNFMTRQKIEHRGGCFFFFILKFKKKNDQKLVSCRWTASMTHHPYFLNSYSQVIDIKSHVSAFITKVIVWKSSSSFTNLTLNAYLYACWSLLLEILFSLKIRSLDIISLDCIVWFWCRREKNNSQHHNTCNPLRVYFLSFSLLDNH